MAIKTSFARWVAGAAVTAVGLWSISAFAAAAPVPATLTQQGRILDATTGDPVSSKVQIVFNVYADKTGGTALWTETQSITLDDGYFSAQLGSVPTVPPAPTLDTVFDGSVRYLGVTVGTDAEMTPREALTSVPYAFIAGNAATAATAASVPFTGLTGFPAACADGTYLKGFTAAGAAVCAAVPALSCHTVSGTAATATSNFVGCGAGEVITGGGCSTGGILASSYIIPPCISGPGKFCLLCTGQFACANDYYCATTASVSITPFARCCTVL
jgi:hypothetical protein